MTQLKKHVFLDIWSLMNQLTNRGRVIKNLIKNNSTVRLAKNIPNRLECQKYIRATLTLRL